MAEQPDPIDLLREELAEARAEIASLRVRTVTTLSSSDFITLILLTPMVVAFVILGVLIVYKTTSNPAAVAPFLEPILLSLSIFSLPVSAGLGAVMQRYADQRRNQ